MDDEFLVAANGTHSSDSIAANLRRDIKHITRDCPCGNGFGTVMVIQPMAEDDIHAVEHLTGKLRIDAFEVRYRGAIVMTINGGNGGACT